MCKSIISWVEDSDVAGAHNSRPVMCDEYVSALEQYLETGSITDKIFLDMVRRQCNLVEHKENPRQAY